MIYLTSGKSPNLLFSVPEVVDYTIYRQNTDVMLFQLNMSHETRL